MARILVIDDDVTLNAMIVQMLTQSGYEACGAPNGSDGLKMFREQSFDLIITDIVMPVKEGLETIREIRKSDRKIPIIAISGGGSLSPKCYLPVARDFGADYIFQKPFDKEPFLAAVRESLVN
jgi:DNA-binding response OmpR family regulator